MAVGLVDLSHFVTLVCPQGPDMGDFDPGACMPEIIVPLHVQPEFGGGVKCFGQAKGYFGAYTHVPVDKLGNGFGATRRLPASAVMVIPSGSRYISFSISPG